MTDLRSTPYEHPETSPAKVTVFRCCATPGPAQCAIDEHRMEAAMELDQCWMGALYANPHALGTNPDCLMCDLKRNEQAS